MRKAGTPKNMKSSSKKKEPTMNDLYEALLQLLELTIVQVLQKAEEVDSVDVIIDPFENNQLSQQQVMMNPMMMAQPMMNFMPFLSMNPMMASVNPMMASMNPMMASMDQAMNPMMLSMNQAMNPMMASLDQPSFDVAAYAQALSMVDMPPQQPYPDYSRSMYNPSFRTPSFPYPYEGTDSGKRVPSDKEKIE